MNKTCNGKNNNDKSINKNKSSQSQLFFWHKNLQRWKINNRNKHNNNYNSSNQKWAKVFLMSDGNTCIAEPHLEVLPLVWFSKGLKSLASFC